jgi:hypothetical protein
MPCPEFLHSYKNSCLDQMNSQNWLIRRPKVTRVSHMNRYRNYSLSWTEWQSTIIWTTQQETSLHYFLVCLAICNKASICLIQYKIVRVTNPVMKLHWFSPTEGKNSNYLTNSSLYKCTSECKCPHFYISFFTFSGDFCNKYLFTISKIMKLQKSL